MARPRSALVIEGGGMRAAFANGVLAAFEQAGHAPWDAVYGTSAGGALAAWAAAGQAEYAESTWDHAVDRRILDWRRGLTLRGPVLDHDFLFEHIYVGNLDLDAVMAAPHPVVVTATDVETGACVYRDLRRGDVLDWLRATGRLPMGAGPPVTIGGRTYVDGGVVDPIPVARAIMEGATDLTVIVNQPPGPRRGDARPMTAMAARRYPGLAEALRSRHAAKEASLRLAQGPPEGIGVRLIHPPRPTGATRLGRDLRKIQGAIAMGREAGRRHLEALADGAGPMAPAAVGSNER